MVGTSDIEDEIEFGVAAAAVGLIVNYCWQHGLQRS
jgi:hypothetical protein